MPKTIFNIARDYDKGAVICDSGIKTDDDKRFFASSLSLFMEKDERISDAVLMAVAALADRKPLFRKLALEVISRRKGRSGN